MRSSPETPSTTSTRKMPRWAQIRKLHPGRSALGLLLVAGLFTLAGCAGTPSTPSRYVLPAAGDVTPVTGVSTPTLVVQPVAISSYLDQEGIVMQLSDIELNSANQNLWADSLGSQLTRNLRQTLTQALPQTLVLGTGSSSDARLSVEVDRFQGRYDGQAVVSGEWQLREGNRVVRQAPFNVTRPLTADGYPALVRTLGEAWQAVGERIASELAHPSSTGQHSGEAP
ncbi:MULTISPECIES: membrane integrity-associated transporter subunit PqiC [unclassified Salinicola]|uniref:PqiC family protein n=1 Tax=unclassified Salinicola TaxID=2634022 RepID=UPI001A904FB5|nr:MULTISPECIES: ABC-type transport auxiliary lipoprotein family protein [unclassified Salinicola]MCE3025855.1 ABC-type transport auxiliary lipoprotein family protein [Salinicola sp. DM10]WIX34779.1 ABC-type transport auxiliary lipoprotein family protein [Salinicola sp. JS01]